MSLSSDRSDAKVCVARVITAAIPEIGASARPANMFAAIRAPSEILSVQNEKYAEEDHQQAGELLCGGRERQ